jgi:hypothetical protein
VGEEASRLTEAHQSDSQNDGRGKKYAQFRSL